MQEFSGTYNCVVTFPKSNEVIRVASLTDEEEEESKQIKRGAHIVHFLQAYRNHLGPSLIRETRPPVETDEFPLDDFQCQKVQKAGPPYLIQGLEYCNGSPENSNYKKTAFCLIWFFYAAETRFGLRHGDLKDANIVFRKPDNQRVTFKLGNDMYYSFVQNQDIPVVIDYDFASVASTESKMYEVGSPNAAAPEAIIARIFNETTQAGRYTIDLYRDWWSVGICLWDFWMGKERAYPVLDGLQERFIREAWIHFSGGLKGADDYWQNHGLGSLFRYAWIQKQLGQPALSDFWKPAFSPKLIDMLVKIPIPLDPLPLNTWQVILLRRLLSWNPEDRHYRNQEWRLITDHFSDLADDEPHSPTYTAKQKTVKLDWRDSAAMYPVTELKESLHHLHQSQTY